METIQYTSLSLLGLANKDVCYELMPEYVLDDVVDKQVLRTALQLTLKRFPNMRSRLVINEEGRPFFEDNGTEADIFDLKESSLCLATEETGGFMFKIMVEGNCIHFRISHALTDGRGVTMFCVALLSNYYELLGEKQEPSPFILKGEGYSSEEESADILLECVNRAKDAPKQEFKIPEGIFSLPEERFDDAEHKSREYIIEFPVEKVLSLAKENDTTPYPVLCSVYDEAVRQAYGCDDALICLAAPFDMRERIGINTLWNGFTLQSVGLDKNIASLPLKEKCAVLRGQIDNIMDPVNLLSNALWEKGLVDQVYSYPYASPEGEMARTMVRNMIIGSNTCFFSYMGRVRIPEGIEKHIIETRHHFVSYFSSVFAVGASVGKTMRISMNQVFESDRLASSIVNVFSKLDIDAKLIDNNGVIGDRLDISKLKRI
ncbi:MAG: hypothetical protein IJS61_10385 [Firmicutes bacterium]|nr:hypothetical protein [Bacillota bacterium]